MRREKDDDSVSKHVLGELEGAVNMNNKSPIQSTAQLARRLGLSRWTVSRALNGQAGVSPRTAERIREAARREGFTPSLLGSGLRTGRTNLAGICLPDLEDYFLTTKITSLQEALRERGLHPLFQITGSAEEENETLARFAAMRCAGVVMIASNLDDDAPGIRKLAGQDIPFVRIDPVSATAGASISTDRRRAISEAMKALHALGHRRVVAAGFSTATSYGRQRIAGLRDGCRQLGWDFSRDVYILTPEADLDDFTGGSRLGRAYLALPQRVSAILAVNDRVATSLMRELHAAGLRVPGDVSLIGYDNADFSPYTHPPLATIDPQVNELIRGAVEMLGANDRSASKRVRPRLVPRDSLGPAPRTPP
jgi:LacI family transcriptional regulator